MEDLVVFVGNDEQDRALGAEEGRVIGIGSGNLIVASFEDVLVKPDLTFEHQAVLEGGVFVTRVGGSRVEFHEPTDVAAGVLKQTFGADAREGGWSPRQGTGRDQRFKASGDSPGDVHQTFADGRPWLGRRAKQAETGDDLLKRSSFGSELRIVGGEIRGMTGVLRFQRSEGIECREIDLPLFRHVSSLPVPLRFEFADLLFDTPHLMPADCQTREEIERFFRTVPAGTETTADP